MQRKTAWALAGLSAGLVLACSVVEEPSDDEGRFGASSVSSATGVGGAAVSASSVSVGGAPSGSSTQVASSTVTGSSSSTVGSGGSCPDTSDEPNNSEEQASKVGTLDDCDEVGLSVKGVLAGNDVDWYTYDGQDKFLCVVEPSRTITSSAQVRLCKFFDCKGVKVTCPAGTTADMSPNGHPGCCSVNGFAVTPTCSGLSDDATVYLRVDKPPSFPCVQYDLSFHY